MFSENGIVGIIHNSSKHFAVVKSVLTENINIDVMVEPMGLFGLMKWDGGDPRFGNITGISNDLKLKKWLKVVTRGGSGIFPRGLPNLATCIRHSQFTERGTTSTRSWSAK